MKLPRFKLPQVHFWEPEETVGTAWHETIRDIGAEPKHPESAVAFDAVRQSTGILFRASGGLVGTDILPVANDVAGHRLQKRRRLAHDVDHITHARFDGQRLALPIEIKLFADADLNRGLYLWLAALSAHIAMPDNLPAGPVMRDIAALRAAIRAEQNVLAALPGLRALRQRLGEQLLADRPVTNLPPAEEALELAIRAVLAGDIVSDPSPVLLALTRDDAPAVEWRAPQDYKTFRPVALWPIIHLPEGLASSGGEDHAPQEQDSSPGSEKILKAQRRASDQADRKDSFILHRFESIMSWVEFLNINRAVEDEDEDQARKAAQDLDEVSLAKHSKSAKTKLKFHLDLAPQDLDRTRLIGECTYPEWDWKAGSYLPDHVKVEERLAEEGPTDAIEAPRARRRINAVKKQFEALRPRQRIARRQGDGFDLDLDEVIRARCDLMASGEASDRLYCAIRDDERDLAVSVLIDVSRSTESAVSGRPVIDCAREALVALMEGIEACGDAVSVHAFSSLRRSRVMVEKVKDFDEQVSPAIHRRVMGLKPKFYTRLGAAIRHVGVHLGERAAQRRLLLVITDGKPNDLDHYEGRHGIEDTRRAIQEARRKGQAVFGVAVDAKAHDYVPHLFGQNGFAMVPNPDRLIDALPIMYKHVVA